MSRRTCRRTVSRINERTRRDWTDVVGADICKPWTRARHCSRPGGWNHRRASRYPIVGSCADSTCDPTNTRFQNDFVNCCTTNSEEHVVVHLEAFNAVEDFHARTCLTLAKNERVVYESVATICVIGSIAPYAGHSCTLSWDVLKDVAHNIRILASRVVTDVLVPVRIGTNQFYFAIKATRDPVVVNLITLSAALNIVTTVLIVQITVLHSED